MIDIGKTLKEEREKQKLTIEEIADKTLIRPYYLEEIENNNFHYYDGFIAAYIRKYANLLGIEAEPLLASYRELFKEKPLEPKRKNVTLIIILISICALLILFFVLKRFVYAPQPTQQPSQSEVNNSPQENPGEETTPLQPPIVEPQKPSGIDLVLKADQRSWLGVDIDGVYSQFFLGQGETKELKGKDYIKIRYGNAKHVFVTKNGTNLGVVSATDAVVDVEYKP
jgi:transcriptional regulator with XRE-family HTH domain